MKICGITAEYNLFHKGHAYQIEKARQAGATHILAVMSGNFVQRGVPAMLDKRVRTRAALCGGADLVVELPLPFATASAETFAYGSLSLMQAAGCVDMVSFGVEDLGIGGNLPSLATGIVLILASMIFRYGAALEAKCKC